MAQNPSKNDMIQNVISSYQLKLKDKGIDEEYLAQKAYDALNAHVTKTVKLRGWFDKRKKLPDGYKLIKVTDDEALIEHEQINWATRENARKDMQKLLGLYPSESINVKHGFDNLVGEVVKDILKASRGLPPLPSMEKESEE